MDLFPQIQIQALKFDNGKKYKSNEFNQFCEDVGFEHQLIGLYTPQQNEINERKKHTKKNHRSVYR
ncbi:Retrovirus-related Pol polyprotein from transposon TNT 1-94 [Gossypium australe]|uniref:Retrovirus-related Pol polyprotein from transposon TNT 1-94 n=1 Tax=Gossypium australe TaxID=47621 RepID=A0A5B6WE04_9ROSI|nr:Retrovirus-related Pol polyprotein from transposon TNT 1-94 [Gossypium australe]